MAKAVKRVHASVKRYLKEHGFKKKPERGAYERKRAAGKVRLGRTTGMRGSKLPTGAEYQRHMQRFG